MTGPAISDNYELCEECEGSSMKPATRVVNDRLVCDDCAHRLSGEEPAERIREVA